MELKHWKEMVENPRRPIVHWHVLKVYGERGGMYSRYTERGGGMYSRYTERGGYISDKRRFLMLHFKVYSITLKRLKT